MTLVSKQELPRPLEGQHWAVLGFGVSGHAASALALRLGANVSVFESRPLESMSIEKRELAKAVEYSSDFPTSLLDFDGVIASPGLPPSMYADAEGAEKVISELEFGWRFFRGRCIAITGTNGKSTVTTLVAKMLRAAGIRAAGCGNLGAPLSAIVARDPGEEIDWAVIEVSSYQLERIEKFRPDVSCILNISPDHLDRYESYADYVSAKERILENQLATDIAVVPALDEDVFNLAARHRAEVHSFGDDSGIYADHEGIHVLTDVFSLDAFALRGLHNLQNLCGAATIVQSIGLDARSALRAVQNFPGLAHRMQLVRTFDDVGFINDSKATNVGAALASLRALSQPILWVAGGVHKGSSYKPILEAAKQIRCAFLFGQAAGVIENELGDQIRCELVGTLNEAVHRAAESAAPGDIVLLAPACSSFDMFESYEERGNRFAEIVHGLKENG